MDLSPTAEQRLVADSANALLTGQCTPAAVRAAMAGEHGFDAALWRQLGEQGWCGLSVGEACGGQALGLAEAALLQEALGAHLACVPYFDSVVLAATALGASGVQGGAQLQALARGQCISTLGFDAVPARRVGNTWTISGCWPALGSAQVADAWLLPVRDMDADDVAGADQQAGLALLWVTRDSLGFSVRVRDGADTTQRSADVLAQSALVDTAACVAQGAAAAAALESARLHGAIVLAAEQLGVATRCLEMACSYTMQRQQFGRAVASFQAVKHRCAQMLVLVEAARSAVRGAACVADASPSPQALTCAAAQALCAASEAAAFASQEAIQLHGGMGYTWDCDAHLYLRRAQANRQRLGPPSRWLKAVAAQLLDDVTA